MRHLVVLSAVIALVALMPAGRAAADNGDKLSAVPFEYVGAAGDCGTGYPAGSRIVTAAWLGGMGLPDNGGASFNLADPRNNPNKNDPHTGLLLSKNGPTPDCSSAGAEIKGVKGMDVGTVFLLGFDYRGGGHCGAGAPRFNVVTRNGGVDTFHFFGGCQNGVSTVSLQDPQWYRVRFALTDPTVSFPPATAGDKIVSIDILYDEGTDANSTQDPMGVGLAVIDNIYINGKVITSGDNSQKHNKDKKDKKDKGDDNGDNEGDDD